METGGGIQLCCLVYLFPVKFCVFEGSGGEWSQPYRWNWPNKVKIYIHWRITSFISLYKNCTLFEKWHLIHYFASTGSTESFHCSFIFWGAGKAAACSYIQVWIHKESKKLAMFKILEFLEIFTSGVYILYGFH